MLIDVFAGTWPSPWQSPIRLFLLCCCYCLATTVAPHAPQSKESATTMPAFASPPTTIHHPLSLVIFGGGYRQQKGTSCSPLNKICHLLLLLLCSKQPSTLEACLILRPSEVALCPLLPWYHAKLSWNKWFRDYQYVFYLEKVIFHLGKVYFNWLLLSI